MPKVGTMLGLLVLSRVGIYIPLPGIDRVAFAEAFSKASFLGYVDALAGEMIKRRTIGGGVIRCMMIGREGGGDRNGWR